MTQTVADIRPARPEDAAAIQHVHERAFGDTNVAQLVDLLHAAHKALIAFVAVAEDHVVGHILFSPVTVAQAPAGFYGVGLAPLGVLPAFQGQSIGSRLARDGLEACRRAGYDAVVVLGNPRYYTRFGFSRASAYQLANEYNADDAFMVLELKGGILQTISGLVQYQPEFRATGC
jgi:putative acetyltransferase